MKEKDKVSIWNRTEGNIVPYIMNTSMVIIFLLLIYNFYTGRLTFEDFGWLKFW